MDTGRYSVCCVMLEKKDACPTKYEVSRLKYADWASEDVRGNTLSGTSANTEIRPLLNPKGTVGGLRRCQQTETWAHVIRTHILYTLRALDIAWDPMYSMKALEQVAGSETSTFELNQSMNRVLL